MLKVTSVTVGPKKYGTEIETVVKFQIGTASYNTTEITLSPEATREIIDLAIAKATAEVAIDAGGIRVAGEPLPLIAEAPDAADPEFAEVDEPESVPVAAPEEWTPPEPGPVPEPLPEEAF